MPVVEEQNTHITAQTFIGRSSPEEDMWSETPKSAEATTYGRGGTAYSTHTHNHTHSHTHTWSTYPIPLPHTAHPTKKQRVVFCLKP